MPPAADAITMRLPVRTSLLGTAEHGTVTVGARAAGGTGPWAAPVLARDAALDRLTTLTRSQAIGGFTAFTSTLVTAEQSVDAPLPMLDASLLTLFSPADQLLDMLAEQGVASVTCGAANTSPPSGAPVPGKARYCQARTQGLQVDADTPVTWTASDGATIAAGTATRDTVGPNPTANIALTGGGGFPRLKVAFTSGGTVRTARSAIASIQELGAIVAELGLGGGVTYDPAKQTLEVAVASAEASRTRSVRTGGAANLAPVSGLTGLCQAERGTVPRRCARTGETPAGEPVPADAGDAQVTLTDLRSSATFGIGLAAPQAPVVGQAAPPGPVVYLEPAAGGTVWEIGGLSASVPAGAKLSGRIGFLQNDVDLTAFSLRTGSTAASVRLTPGDVVLPDGTTTTSGAVEVVRLGGSAAGNEEGVGLAPIPTRDITATATLAVADAPDGPAPGGVRPINRSGSLTATWANLDPSVLPTVVTAGDYDHLRLFDLAPSQQALAGPDSSGLTLSDPNADFSSTFRVFDDATGNVERSLYNTTTGKTCSAFVVVSETSLRCTEGTIMGTPAQTYLAGGETKTIAAAPAGSFTPGDAYVIDGLPNALRDLLIDSIASVADGLATADRDAPTFPIVDLRPGEITGASDQIDASLVALRAAIADSASDEAVSTLQGFRRSLGPLNAAFQLVDGTTPTLKLDVSSSGNEQLTVPLRLSAGDSQVRILSDGVDPVSQLPTDIALPVQTASTAAVALEVDLSSGETFVGPTTRAVQSVTGMGSTPGAIAADLRDQGVEYGSAAVRTKDNGSARLDIGIDVTTRSASTGRVRLGEFNIDGPSALRPQATRTVRNPSLGCGFTSTKHAACASVDLAISGGEHAVRLAYDANDSSGGTGADLGNQPLAVQFLSEGVGTLSGTLGDALDGDLAGMTLPLLGANLDGSADIPNAVTAVSNKARRDLGSQLADLGPESEVTVDALEAKITAAFDPTTLNVSAGSTSAGSTGTPTVTALCSGGVVCSGTALMTEIREIRSTLTLTGTTTGKAPFDVGVNGLPIVSDLKVDATTDWTLGPLTLGIKRGTGPYLLMAPDDGKTDLGVLHARVRATLPTRSDGDNQCHTWGRLNGDTGMAALETAAQASLSAEQRQGADVLAAIPEVGTARCLDAVLGYLPTVMVDRGSGATGTGVDTAVDVAVTPGIGAGPADADGRVYLPALVGKQLPTTTTAPVTGDSPSTGRIDVYFEGWAGELGLFDVLGTVRADWAQGRWQAAPGLATEQGNQGNFRFDHLRVDGNTVAKAVSKGYDPVARQVLTPLDPLIEFLTADIPVLSQLAQSVGAGRLSLLTLMNKAKQDTKLISNVIELQQLFQNLPAADDTPDLLPLSDGPVGGRFVIDNRGYQKTTCVDKALNRDQSPGGTRTTKGNGDISIDGNGEQQLGVNAYCAPGIGDKVKGLKNDPAAALKQYAGVKRDPTDKFAKGFDNDKKSSKQTAAFFSLPSVSVPVLEDSDQVYGLLLGTGETSLLRVELGKIGASLTYSRSFGPLMIGPVPLVARVGVRGTVEGRFAFGFDTHGLTQRLEALELPGDVKALGAQADIEVFREGFYFDDLDESRSDVPEFKVIFGAFAGAAVSIGFAEAGIDGGVDFDISFNAHDPNRDGKVRFEEYRLLRSPACLFDVSAGLSFYLSARLHVDLFLFSVDKLWDIFRSPRIKLFDFSCSDQPIVLATKDETARTLTLTIGKPDTRQGFLSATHESYAVKQLGAAAAGRQRFSVTAFNLTQVYDVPAGTVIVADGAAGNDQVRLLPGVEVRTAVDGAKTVETIEFIAPSRLQGGVGNDRLVGASGVDDIEGGADTDTIEGGSSDDTLRGGAGNDTLDGGLGGDGVDGGEGNDSVSGGAGADIVRGGDGDDQLDGGAGAGRDALFPTTDAAAIAGLLDSGDAVVGEGGNDVITGGDGADIVVGGSLDTSTLVRTSVENVNMLGVQQSGALVTVPVALATIALPTLAQVRATCAEAGTAATPAERDTVSGGAQGDHVIGGGGHDELSGGAGNDIVCGRGGDDLLFGDGGDATAANEGADEVRGGPGADRLFLGGGADQGFGDAGNDLAHAGEGDDTLTGGDGADLLLGEAGVDRIIGDDPATAAGEAGSARAIVCRSQTSIVNGMVDLDGDLVGSSTDTGQLEGLRVVSGLVRDAAGNPFSGVLGSTVFSAGRADLDGDRTADSPSDTGVVPLAGVTGSVGNGDCILGGDGSDAELAGGDGGDHVDGGTGDEAMVRGDGGDDLVRGGTGDDTVVGDAGNDLVIGDSGDDALEGNDGDDVLRGGAGVDLLIGGSQIAGAVDGADELLADRGNDVLAGDNARMVRVSPANTGTAIPGVSLTLLATIPRPGGTLADKLFGGFDDDWAFGQTGADLVRGGQGRDVVEGGPDADTVQGDDDADLVVGGSSTDGEVTPSRSGAGLADGGDLLLGDAGADGRDGSDVIAGDNARLDPGPMQAIPLGASVRLFDVVAVGQTAPAGSGGADTIHAGGGNDAVYAQHGDDEVHGGGGHDVIEGDAGSDRLFGDADDDAIVGGSSVATNGEVVATRVADGQADGGDLIDGGSGNDVIAGDNARLLEGGPATRADGTRARLIRLFDAEVTTATPTAAGRGADTLLGAAGKDIVFGQGGADWISGGDGDDIAEGNAGGDTIAGNGGEDDLTGGGSATDGIVISSTVDRLLTAPSGLTDGSAAKLRDGGDTVYGGDTPSVPANPALDPASIGTAADSHDVILGDNGRITRTGAADGWRTLSGASFSTRIVRTVAMADPAAGATAGSDALFGQAGDDDVYGGFDSATTPAPVSVGGQPVPGDLVDGGAGDDALIGDQGSATPTPAGNLGSPTTLTVNAGFVVEPVRAAGSLVRVVTLTQATVGGTDVLRGDAGRDALHPGAGNDLADGGADDDVVFGADGDDALWGGTGHDRLFGGLGVDSLDIKVRPGDPALWGVVRPAVDQDGRRSTVNGLDTIYGGKGGDEMQADQGDTGTSPGDRLLDWVGPNNLYFVCDGGYGAGQALREQSPATSALLIELARSTGAVDPATAGSSGHGELALLGLGERDPATRWGGAKGKGVCEAQP
ncbi:MAG: hypothetical protein M3503_01130 [Actinomycetota bacterium]|nr:hypothetical protein [Actinomycetota bacterium]